MDKLKIFRQNKGLSQVKFAQKIGVSQSMYEKVERGYMKPSRNFMGKLKKTYPEANIDSIFFGF
ncbi:MULTISPECIES: helix-turn-helix domain-containing protein [Bacillus cereus group]|uniref:helix-turn-helix domain-containing protein n=1 Tax=Bacillus cereus group TaxID=86661 RepID=UPI00210028DC|nr:MULTISPECIES: helix-turn-helix transcriptional regulator [Bacillus cereus group]